MRKKEIYEDSKVLNNLFYTVQNTHFYTFPSLEFQQGRHLKLPPHISYPQAESESVGWSGTGPGVLSLQPGPGGHFLL